VLGNGALLATLSERARVEGLFWPSVDRGSHVGELRLGIERNGKLFWLDEEEHVQQSYLQDTNVLLTRLGDVEVVDLVHELEPVLLRRVSGEGRLVVQCRPELDGSTRLIGASVEGNRVVFYRRDVALAIGALGAEAFSHGFGSAEGGIACTITGQAVVVLAFGCVVARGRRQARCSPTTGLHGAACIPPPPRFRAAGVGGPAADLRT